MSHSPDSSLTAAPLGSLRRRYLSGEIEGQSYARRMDARTGATRDYDEGKPAKPSHPPTSESL